jgi:hypothetical protein
MLTQIVSDVEAGRARLADTLEVLAALVRVARVDDVTPAEDK